MTEALLLDTHIALWLDSGDDHLRQSTRTEIDDCWQSGGTIRLSAISVGEITLLLDNKRIDLDVPIEAWVARFLQRPGIEAIDLTHRAAARSYRFYQLEHPRPGGSAADLHCNRTPLSARHL